ncbi:Zn(II)2Cys6 transcription factor domain-containing protein [Aspergillus melleus]|uniref:Zn(II)2Cys6 transcription factor domain-containing protein n=1 Tax=Aspergillus melleus TaxID=138277 RepID=UPI001E8DFC03|nr:uncharacterized protein LDX57_009117 [Aspergillus melleus]KAH8431455.1 hypothetical protein LDX57_009117 [Aspergillus melleus]
MVNHGRSNGCLTCKRRRVKCDEARPNCHSCQRLGLHCGGYKAKPTTFKFKDQSHKFGTEVVPKKACPSPRPLAEPDTSVPFFLQHYAVMGRDMQSASGFFELLVPVYSSQPQKSALSLAVSAIASEVISLWRHDSFGAPQKAYLQAVKCLRSTIQDPSERGKPATVLAVLSLQFYENLAAIYDRRPASRVHHDGAISLLPFAKSDFTNRLVSGYLRKYIFHSEMSSAIRQNRPLQSIVRSSFTESNDSTTEPANPSFLLDSIGASVAELQASYFQRANHDDPMLSKQHDHRDWRTEAQHIDEQLLAWARSVPEYWRPRKLTSGQDIEPLIPTYESVCEVYPSCQIGTIWNLWRVQRLLLIKIILSSDEISARDEDFVSCKQALQELVDSVCHSVPFYLGNQAGPLSLADFADPAVFLPIDLLPPDDVLGSGNESNWNEHRSHIIAQGPWHILSPLSRVVTFFLEDHGPLMKTFLRPGQYEWIREQFLRVTILLRIPLVDTDNADEVSHQFNSSVQGSVDTRVENLARKVRKSAVFMSGP